MLEKHLIAHTEPVANPENIIFYKDYRITVLGERLFRLEKSKDCKFRDKATQTVWFRNAAKQNYETYEQDGRLHVKTPACTLIVAENRADCRVISDGKIKKADNTGNLKGTYRTLDCCDGNIYYEGADKKNKGKSIKLGNGVCSRTGVAVLDDGSSLNLLETGELAANDCRGTDEYIFVFGNDYRGAVKALFGICGKTPLVPRFALGNWWSRYYAYSDSEYMKLLQRFRTHNVPLTVATIDMDWHWSETLDEEMKISASGKNTDFYGGNFGWTGYSWNTKLFPDYKRFLKEVKDFGLKITLNIHPADGVRWFETQYEKMAEAVGADASCGQQIPFNIADSKFINAYFSVLHKPYEADGVDFWWIDWQQGTKSALAGLDPLWALNHYHYADIMKSKTAPLILSRFAGTGSHRYPLGFSGDTFITWKTLAYLPYFTLTASNVGYTWWSHDIGGHMQGTHDGELFLRHVQFGVFSPVNRLHCTSLETMSKEPWVYLNGAGEIAENWLRFRHRMIPFLYSCDYQTHSKGAALIEPLYYEWDTENAYKYKKEYIFGGQLLVAPVVTPAKKDGFARTKVWLPQGRWTDIFTGDVYDVPQEDGTEKTLLRNRESIPALAKQGAILPLSQDEGNSVKNPEHLEILVYSGNGSFDLYEDDRENGKDGACLTKFTATCETKGEFIVQTLEISTAEGKPLVGRRFYSVVFKSVKEGKLTVFEDGKQIECETPYSDFATASFYADGEKKYRAEVWYKQNDKLKEIKLRAKEVLLRADGDNDEKEMLYKKILSAETEEAYKIAAQSSSVGEGVKLRLLETI